MIYKSIVVNMSDHFSFQIPTNNTQHCEGPGETRAADHETTENGRNHSGETIHFNGIHSLLVFSRVFFAYHMGSLKHSLQSYS